MPRLLFTTLPSNDLGLLTRSLPVARELSARKHEIAFCSPARAPRTLIADAGFDNLTPKHPFYYPGLKNLNLKSFIQLILSKQVRDDYGSVLNFFYQLIRSIPVKLPSTTSEIWNMDHAAAMAGMMNRNFIQANCDAMINLINDFQADVIIDLWNPFASIAARVLQKPLVTIIQSDSHPNSNGFIWWKKQPDKLPSAIPAINKVLAQYGLQSISKVEDLSIGDLTLILGTPETDPLPEGSDGTYIGPVLWQKNNADLPAWFYEINDGKPIIWVYSGNPRYSRKGTVLDSGIILQASIEALAKQDVHVVLTTGHHAVPEQFLPLPTNFHFASYLPGLSLAEKCNLMIHHGGYGSCQTGLYTGTPAVIIPTFSERESNARRIASLGAGELVLPITGKSGTRRVDIDDFKDKIMHVLNTPAYEKNVKRYSKIIQSYGGAQKAVRLIDNFIKEKIR